MMKVSRMDWPKERLAVLTPETGALLMVLFVQMGVVVTSVLDSPTLLGWLFIGSVFGAFVKTAIAPPNLSTAQRNLQQLAAEFSASMFCGVAIGAGVIWACGLEMNSAVAISIGFTFSCLGISFVHKAGPMVEQWSIRRLAKGARNYLQIDGEDEEKNRRDPTRQDDVK